MANLTEPRDTRELVVAGGIVRERTAAAAIHAGAIVAVNSDGGAVPAVASGGYTVIGVAQNTVSSGGTCRVKAGVFLVDNAASGGVAAGDLLKECYIEDDHTVTITSGGCVAGKVIDVNSSDGVAVRLGL